MSDSKSDGDPVAGLDWRAFTPEDSPRTPPDMMADPVRRALTTADLDEGDPAYDFELPVFDFSDGTRRETDERFHLQQAARTRPVALIFGSYT